MSRRHAFVLSALVVAASLAPCAYAAEKHKHKHKSHGAHEHGAAKLNLVVEGTKLTAQFEASSESLYGFEYEPKTDKEKKQRDAAGEKLKSNFEKMLVLDKTLGCAFQNTKLNLHVAEKGAEGESKPAPKEGKKEAVHSETHAEFVATCQKPLAGTKASFAFRTFFPGVREIRVQVLSEAKQAGAEITNDKGDVTL